MVRSCDYAAVEQLLFGTATYALISTGALKASLRGARRTAATLADEIAKMMDEPRIKGLLMKPMKNTGGLVSTLQLKVKSHKPAGKVLPRPLHASCGYCFESCSRWACGLLREQISGHPCIVKNSEAVKVDAGGGESLGIASLPPPRLERLLPFGHKPRVVIYLRRGLQRRCSRPDSPSRG